MGQLTLKKEKSMILPYLSVELTECILGLRIQITVSYPLFDASRKARNGLISSMTLGASSQRTSSKELRSTIPIWCRSGFGILYGASSSPNSTLQVTASNVKRRTH
jgi:hypothetical protein